MQMKDLSAQPSSVVLTSATTTTVVARTLASGTSSDELSACVQWGEWFHFSHPLLSLFCSFLSFSISTTCILCVLILIPFSATFLIRMEKLASRLMSLVRSQLKWRPTIKHGLKRWNSGPKHSSIFILSNIFFSLNRIKSFEDYSRLSSGLIRY